MSRLLIVDGYNMIYAADRYLKWRESDFEMARVKLIEDLAMLKATKGYEVMLVFDAAKTTSSHRSHTNILGIDVMFTKAGETADAMIERIVYKSEHPDDIIVATSDYTQQKVIFKPGVLRMSSRELLSELSVQEKELDEHPKKGGRFRLEERLDGAVRNALERMIGVQ
ncbi:MAG: NYN domain-containing protein [Rubrobacteridae bacterium]|nr:NYN domain-containing protein [Rubrobacteridae bacterium]